MCTCAAHRMQAHRRAWHGIAPSPPSTRRLPLHPRTRVPRPERRRRLRACTAVLRLRLPTRRWRLNASEGGGRTRELPILSTSSTTRLVVILRQLSPGDPRSAVLPGRDRGRKHTRREPGDDKSAVCASTHGHLGAVARSWLGSHILVECVVWNAVAGRESRKRGMRGRTGKPRAWNAWPDGKAASVECVARRESRERFCDTRAMEVVAHLFSVVSVPSLILEGQDHLLVGVARAPILALLLSRYPTTSVISSRSQSLSGMRRSSAVQRLLEEAAGLEDFHHIDALAGGRDLVSLASQHVRLPLLTPQRYVSTPPTSKRPRWSQCDIGHGATGGRSYRCSTCALFLKALRSRLCTELPKALHTKLSLSIILAYREPELWIGATRRRTRRSSS